MKNRFDLEQRIMNCWCITDDIDTLYRSVCNAEMDEDKIANILLGMKQLYQLKFDDLFDCYETLVSERKIV